MSLPEPPLLQACSLREYDIFLGEFERWYSYAIPLFTQVYPIFLQNNRGKFVKYVFEEQDTALFHYFVLFYLSVFPWYDARKCSLGCKVVACTGNLVQRRSYTTIIWKYYNNSDTHATFFFTCENWFPLCMRTFIVKRGEKTEIPVMHCMYKWN